MSSFYVSLNALNASSTAVASVGNNLANLNTTGYKATTVSFRDMMSQQIGTGLTASSVGMGVVDPIVQHQFTQGSVQGTKGLFDAAIQGNGYFVVKDASGNVNYTRAGNFSLDPNGNLINATGEKVQGWLAANGVINPSGGTSNITVPASSLQIPIPTTSFSMSANLNAGAAKGDTFSTPIQVIDSLGKSHTLTATYTNTGSNTWSYEVTAPGDDVSGGKAGTPSSLSKGSLTFDTSGKLTTPAATASPVSLSAVTFADGSAAQTLKWNLYNTDGSSTLTQYAQASATSATSQDGTATAQPTSVQLGDNGFIVAKYSNGKTVNVAQIALATIINPDSMIPIGNNDFQLSGDTGTPTLGAAATGGRGAIIGSALEASTVDIAKEFTDLMVYQRSYQANSKVITTLDDLAQSVIQLKR